MDTLRKITEAQDEILQKLAECELAVSNLYACYQDCYPHMEDFWKSLVQEEIHHAALLQEVRRDVADGVIMRGMGSFKVSAVEKFLNYLQKKMEEAKLNPPTDEEAISVALCIESSILDSHFFDVVTSDGSVFQRVAEQVSHETHDHVRRVQNEKVRLDQLRGKK